MSKHTKGPWTIQPRSALNPDYVIDSQFSAIATLDPRGKESEADARLIASSPNLLEACQEFLRCGPNAGHNHMELIKMMKDAISKAEGTN